VQIRVERTTCPPSVQLLLHDEVSRNFTCNLIEWSFSLCYRGN